MRFNRDRLRTWVESAMRANIAYHAARRELYNSFMAALDRDGAFELASQDVISIRTILTTRDNRLSDDAKLAYEVLLMKIYEQVADEEEP